LLIDKLDSQSKYYERNKNDLLGEIKVFFLNRFRKGLTIAQGTEEGIEDFVIFYRYFRKLFIYELDRTVAAYDMARASVIMNKVEDNLYNDGYVFRYFDFLKEDSYMYQINVNRTRMEYDIFDAGDISTEEDTILSNILGISLMENGPKGGPAVLSEVNNYITDNGLKALKFRDRRVGYSNLIGWNISEYKDALIESGYFNIEITEEKHLNKKGEKRILYRHTYPKLYNYAYILHEPFPDLDKVAPYYFDSSRTMYLYKFLNNQGSPKLNMNKLCKQPHIDAPTLQRMLLLKDPKFRGGHVKDMGVKAICSLFNVRSELVASIPEVSKQLMIKPGSRYERELSKEFLSIGQLPEEKLSKEYQKYLDRCNNHRVTEKDIIFDAIELGLGNYIQRNMSRNELCELIRNYLESVLEYRYS
jgi:hypothetical protein